MTTFDFVLKHVGFDEIRDTYRGIALPASNADLNAAVRHPDFIDGLTMRLLVAADLRFALRRLNRVATPALDLIEGELAN